MPAKYIYWDSNCFIYRIGRHPDYILALEEVTRRAENNELVLVTSVFTLAEVAIVDEGTDFEVQENMIMDFFDNDFIYPVAFDESVCKLARQIVRTCKLKGKDAVHVATALTVPNISSMQTYDKDVLKIPKKLKDRKLLVETPAQWLIELNHGQTVLDMEAK